MTRWRCRYHANVDLTARAIHYVVEVQGDNRSSADLHNDTGQRREAGYGCVPIAGRLHIDACECQTMLLWIYFSRHHIYKARDMFNTRATYALQFVSEKRNRAFLSRELPKLAELNSVSGYALEEHRALSGIFILDGPTGALHITLSSVMRATPAEIRAYVEGRHCRSLLSFISLHVNASEAQKRRGKGCTTQLTRM